MTKDSTVCTPLKQKLEHQMLPQISPLKDIIKMIATYAPYSQFPINSLHFTSQQNSITQLLFEESLDQEKMS